MPYRVTERGEWRRPEMHTRLVDAVQRLFSERGYSATPLREVVELAGTTITFDGGGVPLGELPNIVAGLRARTAVRDRRAGKSAGAGRALAGAEGSSNGAPGD